MWPSLMNLDDQIDQGKEAKKPSPKITSGAR